MTQLNELHEEFSKLKASYDEQIANTTSLLSELDGLAKSDDSNKMLARMTAINELKFELANVRRDSGDLVSTITAIVDIKKTEASLRQVEALEDAARTKPIINFLEHNESKTREALQHLASSSNDKALQAIVDSRQTHVNVVGKQDNSTNVSGGVTQGDNAALIDNSKNGETNG